MGCKRSQVRILSPRLIFQNEPFGEYIEGLSYYGAKTYVDETAVQKLKIKHLTLLRHTRRKPFRGKILRGSKSFGCHVLLFIPRAINSVKLWI
jgi:hypothetical protein